MEVKRKQEEEERKRREEEERRLQVGFVVVYTRIFEKTTRS